MRTVKYLKRCREMYAISQADIGDELGFHSQAVSNIERGVSPLPLKHLSRWCDLVKADKQKVVAELVFDYKTKINKAVFK